MRSIITLGILTAVSLGGSSYGQDNTFAINAAGGSNTIGANTYEWSIAEMTLVNTVEKSNLIVTQGLLQPMLSVVGILPDKQQLANISVFPNPTSDKVFIRLRGQEETNLEISVVDIRGRLLKHKETLLKSGMEQTEIDFNSFAAGIYMLSVSCEQNSKKSVSTFKIEKK